ncbi:MAG: YtxH domain-containing protein [Prolixibacteraceae bacterium]|jgi:gas vesicle protein
MKSDNVLLGLLVGVSAGAILGILVAPKITSAKRKIFRKKVDFADELNDKFDELLESITEKLKNVQKETSEFIAQERQKIDELKKTVKTAKD